jgi:hypothetical protein
MLNEDGNESLNRAENGSVDDDRAGKAWLEWVLGPYEFFLIELILGVGLGSEGGFLVLFVSTFFIASTLVTVLIEELLLVLVLMAS